MQPGDLFAALLFCGAALIIMCGVIALVVWALRRPNQRSQVAPVRQMAQSKASVATPPQSNHPQPYAAIPTLLTAAEQGFLATLRAAAPNDLLICPQVRLANLVHPTARDRQQNKYDFYRIQAKCVDFVLCEAATTRPRLVVELDDSSHNRADRQARHAFVDAVLAQVGLPILHVPWQRSYDRQSLADRINGALGRSHVAEASVWTRPIPVRPAISPVPEVSSVAGSYGASLAVVEVSAYAAHYACGTCQREVRREAKFCSHCGSLLAM